MTRADALRGAQWLGELLWQMLQHLLRDTHPALLMPALLLLSLLGSLALALVVAAAVAGLALFVIGAFLCPMAVGLNTLLGAVVAWQPRKAVAS